MKLVATYYGYDVFELTATECRQFEREFPCLCVYYDNWDDAEDGVRTPNNSESEFGSLAEAKAWCKEYRRR